jgi:hypothetical protein
MHSPRFSLRRIAVLFCLFFLATFAVAFAQPDAAPVSNGEAGETAAVLQTLARLDAAVATRDANTLRFFGVEEIPPQAAILQAQTRATHIAFSPAGALVRQAFRISGASDARTTPTILATGVHEFWPAVPPARAMLSTKVWSAAPSRAATTTFAPRLANCKAASRPMPLDAPSTTTTCSSIGFNFMFMGEAKWGK